MKKKCILILSAFFTLSAAWSAEQFVPLFTKQDPGISVDGYLEKNDWDDIKYQFTFPDKVPPSKLHNSRTGKWRSVKDLSGTVKLAWRSAGLYIGARVVDDKFSQTQTGTAVYEGDHIELFIDTTPGIDSAEDKFGSGQYHILLSPGNLNTRNAKAEAMLVKPRRSSLPEVLIAARKTADGYTLEAMIPWSVLGLKRAPALNEKKVIGLDVVLSDTDTVTPQQEKILFAGKAPWSIARKRMLKAIFTDARGTIPADVSLSGEKILLKSPRVLKAGESFKTVFTLDKASGDVVPVLNFQGHNVTRRNWYAGYSHLLLIKVNGKDITHESLLEKPFYLTLTNGKSFRIMRDNRILLPFLNKLSKMPKPGDKNYPFRDSIDMCSYRFNLEKLFKPGKNTIEFKVISPHSTSRTKLLKAAITFNSRQAAKTLRPAPTGKIPFFTPKKVFKTPYKVTSLKSGKIAFEVNSRKMILESRFSTPEGKYVTTGNKFFKFSRKIEKKDELFILRDTFTNLTKKDLPLIQQYEISPVSGKIREFRLGGLVVSPGLKDHIATPNRSTFIALDKGGAGLYPLSDIFMVHAENYVNNGRKGGITDRVLVLRPGKTITTELAVIPVADGGYYSFINAVRRELDMNYTVPGPLAPLPDSWVWYWNKGARGDKKKIKAFLDFRDAHMVWTGFRCSGPTIRRTRRFNEEKAHALYKLVKELRPKALRTGYFHCFIDWTDRTKNMYPADEVHNKGGKQECYIPGKPSGIFIPTLTNGAGKDTEKNLDYMLKEFKDEMEFFYWDEFNSSKLRYSYNKKHWDGCSADIDPETGKIISKKTSLTLFSHPWRLKMIRKIKKQYPLILINGSFPYGKEMRKEKLICFTEMAQPTNAAKVQVSTPVGLADHYTDFTELICYRQMLEHLDYGVLYYWYSAQAPMTHHTLTRYMFPTTPMELGPGYIIGKERIVTKVSGMWGWGDKSKHEVRVFDHNGWEKKNFKAPLRIVNGKTFTELRLHEFWSAAIIRK